MIHTFQKIPCPLCSLENYSVLFPSTLTKNDFNKEVIKNNLRNSMDDYSKHGQIVRCNNCSLVYTNPREDMRQLLSGYEDVEDQEYIQTEQYRKKLLSKHLKKIKQYKKSGKLLDVGCFAGYFLSLAKGSGFKPYGIEPSMWASKITKKQGAIIIGKDVENVRLKSNYYDVVTLWDVIEHLPNPQQTIKKLHASLKPNGIIALGTPDIDSLFAKLMGGNCPFLIRMHIVLFSPKTLQQLLEQNGFTVVSVSYYGRTFPILYFMEKLRSKNIVIKLVKMAISAIPYLRSMPITLNLRDSFLMIAQKA